MLMSSVLIAFYSCGMPRCRTKKERLRLTTSRQQRTRQLFALFAVLEITIPTPSGVLRSVPAIERNEVKLDTPNLPIGADWMLRSSRVFPLAALSDTTNLCRERNACMSWQCLISGHLVGEHSCWIAQRSTQKLEVSMRGYYTCAALHYSTLEVSVGTIFIHSNAAPCPFIH
ncbi:hypothetical protein BDW22DRAFT_695926 [Trametopsis cervina]|nr:hypothetical protein BDW22DRAFT_695926 [Trametopsis cervina]